MKTVDKLNRDTVKEISSIKNEPKWMTDFRVKSYEFFEKCPQPNFGPKLDIDFDIITYYKRITDNVEKSWAKVECSVKDTFENLGLIDAEKKYLDMGFTDYIAKPFTKSEIEEKINKIFK